MSRVKYAWRHGRFDAKADPNKVGPELERLRNKHGGVLTPKQVVDAAASRRSPLHAIIFEHGDTKSARLHRETVARSVLRTIRVIVTTDGEPRQRRIYVHVKKDEQRDAGYANIKTIDADSAEAVMEDARRGLAQWRARYKELSEHWPGLFDAIDEVLEDIAEEDAA
jgi:hypothetical protein